METIDGTAEMIVPFAGFLLVEIGKLGG